MVKSNLGITFFRLFSNGLQTAYPRPGGFPERADGPVFYKTLEKILTNRKFYDKIKNTPFRKRGYAAV